MMQPADFIWLSLATILVMLMIVPGLALFYGGLLRGKNVLSLLSQILTTLAIVVVLWFAYGYSLGFGENNAFWGNTSRLFFSGMINMATGQYALSSGIPEITFAGFQAAFVAIACCLITGGFAERIKFPAMLIFMALWMTFCYVPVAHMIWAPGGYLSGEALDFAGGTVIHINAGVAALVAARMIGPRIGFGKEALLPHNLPMTMVGASLLWIGWFGFNAGSSLGANNQAALAMFNTLIATAGAIIGWAVVEWKANGRPSLLGAASGVVAGLVGITPAAGYVSPMGALIIGFITAICCVWGVSGFKRITRVDDTLDVFGIHGVGGIVGGLLTGVFNAKPLGGPGLEHLSDIPRQVWIQAQGMLITMVLSALVTFIAIKIAGALCGGIRVARDAELQGLDITSHGEQAYNS